MLAIFPVSNLDFLQCYVNFMFVDCLPCLSLVNMEVYAGSFYVMGNIVLFSTLKYQKDNAIETMFCEM